jgi:hypothetical protein
MIWDSDNTAEFIENFDTIFDCLNSTSVNNMKPYKIQLIKDNLPFNYSKSVEKIFLALNWLIKMI